jgi:hypothetical protein
LPLPKPAWRRTCFYHSCWQKARCVDSHYLLVLTLFPALRASPDIEQYSREPICRTSRKNRDTHCSSAAQRVRQRRGADRRSVRCTRCWAGIAHARLAGCEPCRNCYGMEIHPTRIAQSWLSSSSLALSDEREYRYTPGTSETVYAK